MSKTTVELKVARRVRGFEGRARAAEENAARLYEKVQALEGDVRSLAAGLAALEKVVVAQNEAQNFLRGTLAQLDQSAHGRMDSIMANVEVLRERITTAEPLPYEKVQALKAGFAELEKVVVAKNEA